MSLPTQATIPNSSTAWQLAPAPTYTWSASSGPMTSQQWVAADDSRIVLTGTAAKGTVTGSAAGFVRPEYLADKSTVGTDGDPFFAPAYGIRMATNSQNVWVRLYQRSNAAFTNISNRASVRVKVDGQWTSLDPVYLGTPVGYPASPQNLTAGEYYLQMTFSSAAQRTIELQTQLEFGGFAAETAATVTQAPAVQHSIAFLGDSLSAGEKHGTGNFALTGGSAGTYTSVTSMVWTAAHACGYDNIINVGVGASGFLTVGESIAFSSPTRMQNDVIDHHPDTVFIGTPMNDMGGGKTPAQVQTAATTTLSTIRAALPNALFFILGCPTPPVLGDAATASAAVAPYNAVLKTVAAADGNAWYLDPATGDLYNPSGVSVANQGNWITGRESSISSDNLHPTQAGTRVFGLLLGDMLKLAHPAGGAPGYEESYIPGAYSKDAAGTVRRLRAWVKSPTNTYPLHASAIQNGNTTPPISTLNPPSVAAPVMTTNSATLNWSAVPGATSYRVFKSGVQAIESAGTSATLVGLNPSTTYSFTVQAVAGTVTSAQSAAVVGQTAAPASTAGPTRVASYGPNGTHWPEDTPWKNEVVPNMIEVDCTWAAIKTAIQSVTDSMAAAGTIIKVRPGSLGGNGGSAGSTPVLSLAGSKTRSRNILVMPRDGFGSVQITNSVRINQVYGVTFALLDARDVGVTRTGCTNTHLAWCLVDASRTVGLKGEITENCNSYEVINLEVRVKDVDPHGSGSGYDNTDNTTGSAWLRNCHMTGCYGAPAYLPDPTDPFYAGQDVGYGHNDTWQLYGSNMYYGFFFKDCSFWASPNCAIQIGKFGTSGASADQAAAHARVDAVNGTSGVGATTYLEVDHCLLVDAKKGSEVRYPIPEHAKALTVPQAINDRGAYDRMDLKNSIIYGSVYSSSGNTRYRTVDNVTTNKTQISTLIAPGGGSWTVNPAMDTWTVAQWNALSPIPSVEYLTSIWNA